MRGVSGPSIAQILLSPNSGSFATMAQAPASSRTKFARAAILQQLYHFTSRAGLIPSPVSVSTILPSNDFGLALTGVHGDFTPGAALQKESAAFRFCEMLK